MKILLLALLPALAACSTPADRPASGQPAEDPTRAKIEAYLKKSLDDPHSYESAHWGRVEAFRQRDANKILAATEDEEFENQLALAKAETSAMASLNDMGGSDAAFARHKKSARILVQRADSVRKVAEAMRNSADTTQVGTWVWHSFRAKNKMGALVLDSAHFIVKKTGEVIARKD